MANSNFCIQQLQMTSFVCIIAIDNFCLYYCKQQLLSAPSLSVCIFQVSLFCRYYWNWHSCYALLHKIFLHYVDQKLQLILHLTSIIDSNLEIELNLADIRQEPSKYEVAEKVWQCNSYILAQKLPNIDDLVDMAMVIGKKALHEFLLIKCKEQTIEFTKRSKLK